ncbi:MAG: exodeoxyribonuclease VII small subunit [Clostridia bacterium]|nr:exodeoxyribonuclease VII small subunit [Clostridia bacterium]
MEKQTFEEALQSLEQIVGQLEDGTLSLDESMKAFEQAVQLARFCSTELEGAKQKVRLLTVGEDGSVSDRPFTSTDET